MTGTTPAATPSYPLIGAPAARRLVKLRPTPPPFLESCKAELIVRPIEFISSVNCKRKQETNSPRRLRPAFKKVE